MRSARSGLYPLAAYLLAPAYSAVLLSRGFKERGYWQRFGERLGLGPAVAAGNAGAPASGALWLHAASAGEVQAAAALARALRTRLADAPLVITTSTPAGAARARALLGKPRAAGGEGAEVRFAPLDLPGAVRRFFERVRPRLAVVMETELWPALFEECTRRGVPLALASARLSERSVRRYALLRGLFERTLAHCALIAAQTEADAERFRRLGAAPARTHAVGNLKFDFDVPREALERGRALRERYARGRPVWVAGSTHEGEEQAALDAHARVRQAHADALVVLAPRHPPRFAQVAAWLKDRQIAFARHSRGEACGPHTTVLLLDSIGELLDFYAAADVVFVGGSLVPIGGHNLLEPAALARPILTGPYQANAAEIARLLSERGGVRFVRHAGELGDSLAELLSSAPARDAMGARARAVLEENRGALARLLALIEPLL